MELDPDVAGAVTAWMAHLVVLDPDVAGAVAARVAHLVRKRRAARLLAEVDAEIAVNAQPTPLRVNVDLEHEAALPATEQPQVHCDVIRL